MHDYARQSAEESMIKIIEARLDAAKGMDDLEAKKAQVIRAEGTLDALHIVVRERMQYNNVSAAKPIPADLLNAYQDPTFAALYKKVEAMSKDLWPEFDPD